MKANKVKTNKDKLELEILSSCEGGSDGIINSGHTILAFESAKAYKYDLSKARIKVTIHIGLGEEDALRYCPCLEYYCTCGCSL